jgi:hypothetical protein
MLDPIIRANEFKRIWEGDPSIGDGLKHVFDGIRKTYFERAGQVDPWEGDKLNKLALASRIVDMVEAHVKAAIDSGLIAERDRDAAEKIAKLPERKRRFLV